MTAVPKNLVLGDAPRDFWVWVNPKNWHVRHQISVTGCFVSAGSVGRGTTNLPFLPNPAFAGDISPFTVGVMHDYTAEYNLEINREHYFAAYPSRLNAIFLLDSEEEARKYQERHSDHVHGRALAKVRTNGAYCYSVHDSAWVDFLRLRHGMDDETIHHTTQAYWEGINVDQCQLLSMGKPWTQAPIRETLYMGRVDFYDRSIAA